MNRKQVYYIQLGIAIICLILILTDHVSAGLAIFIPMYLIELLYDSYSKGEL